MTVVLDRAERDALYQFLFVDLTAVDDLGLTNEEDTSMGLARIRRKFDEAMRLFEQLGCEPIGDQELYELILPLEELSWTFERLDKRASRIVSEAKPAGDLDGAVAVTQIYLKILGELGAE